MYIDALVDKETGTLVSPYGASYPVVGTGLEQRQTQ